MRFRITLAEHISTRTRETLIDIFARLGDSTERLTSREIVVDVRRAGRADRLLFVLSEWGRDGVLRWSDENSD
jgi:hypothetical protein